MKKSFGIFIIIFVSSKIASHNLNIHTSSICVALKKNTQTHGFKFKYA